MTEHLFAGGMTDDLADLLATHQLIADPYSQLCRCGKWRDKRDDGTSHRAHIAREIRAYFVHMTPTPPPAEPTRKDKHDEPATTEEIEHG